MKTLLLMIAAAAAPLCAASTAGYTLTQNSTLSIFDANGTEIGAAGFPSHPLSVLFSQDGKTVWSVGQNYKFYGIDVATKMVKFALDIHANYTPVLSPDGTRVYTLTYDGTLVAVDPNTGAILGTGNVGLTGFYLSVSPDSAHVYISANGVVYVVDASSLEITNQFTVAGAADIAALPDNQTLAVRTITDESTEMGPIMRLDLTTGETSPLTSDISFYFILSSDGQTIFSVNNEGQLSAVDVASGEFHFYDSGIIQQTLCASPNGARVYATNTTGLVTTKLASGQYTTTTAGARPYTCAVSPDSTRVWMGNVGANEVNILDIGTGKLAGAIEVPPNSGNMALTPDGTKLFVVTPPGPGTEAQINVINTATGRPVPQTLNVNPMLMAVSPDSTKLVTVSGGSTEWNISVIDIASLTVTSSFSNALTSVNALIFSPDGSRYYIGGLDPGYGGGAVAVYDSVTNNLIQMQDTVNYDGELTIAPNGATLYSGWEASTVQPNRILAIDANSLAEISSSALIPVLRGLVVSLDSSTLYSLGPMAVPGSFALTAVNASTLAGVITTTITGSGIRGGSSIMSLSPDGTALYISYNEQTIVVNTADLSIRSRLQVAASSPYLFGPR